MRVRIDEIMLALGPAEHLRDASPVRERALMGAIGNVWARRRAAYMAEWLRSHPGSRPWAWWRFDQQEDWPGPPVVEVRRLLELDAMDEAELRAVSDRGERIVADQAAGVVGCLAPPAHVLAADVVRPTLGLAPLDRSVFPMPAGWPYIKHNADKEQHSMSSKTTKDATARISRATA